MRKLASIQRIRVCVSFVSEQVNVNPNCLWTLRLLIDMVHIAGGDSYDKL